MGLLTNSIVLISQYTHVSNHHIIHLKLTQCCMQVCVNKAGEKTVSEQERKKEHNFCFVILNFNKNRGMILCHT